MFSKAFGTTGGAGRRNGFTLIELLVVISIVALLVAILLPALGKARATAEYIQCASNIRGGTFTYHLYFNDFEEFMPPVAYEGVGWGYNYGNWYSRLRPYATPRPNLSTAQQNNVVHAQAKEFTCPSPVKGTYAYGYPTLPYGTLWGQRMVNWGTGTISNRSSDFRTPSKTGLLVDMTVYYDALRVIELWRNASGNLESYVSPKHNAEGIGVSYHDGHAEFIRVRESDKGLPYQQVPDYYPFAHREFYGWYGTGYGTSDYVRWANYAPMH